MSRHYFFILFLLCTLSSVHGQYRFDNYKQLTVENGLPSNYSFDLVEDKYGFIWIATSHGLARYDGSKVNHFYKNKNDSINLPSQYIYSLLTRGDSLWIGSRKGLSILNIETGKITNHLLKTNNFELEDNVHERTLLRDIIEDRQGNVWLAPAYEGFVKWDKHLNEFINYPIYPDKSLPKSYGIGEQTGLSAIIQDVDHDSIFWAVNNSGLLKLNTNTNKITRISYQKGDSKTAFNVNRKICTYQSAEGLIYTGSWEAGLSIYDPKTGDYLLPSESYPKTFPNDLKDNTLIDIVAGEANYLYLSYFYGLYKYNIQSHTFQLVNRSIHKGKSTRFGINFVDSNKRTWNSTPYGIVVADPIGQQYKWQSVAAMNPSDIETIPRAIVEDFYPGYISLAGQYTDGIYHVNPTTGESFKNVFDGKLVSDNYFSSRGMSQLDERTLLINSGQDIYTHQKGNAAFVPFDPKLPMQFSYLMNNLVDDYGSAWFGCRMDGLFAIDLATKKITSYADQVPYNFISRNFQDSKGNVWFQKERGHLVFNRKLHELNVFHHKKDTTTTFSSARNFCECPNGEIWIAGIGEGIGLVSAASPEKGIINKIAIKNKADKPLDVQRIACNQQNELWAIGSGGIQKIDRSDWSCETFSLAYGIKIWTGMFQFLKNGDLFVGSRDGFYTFDPHDLLLNSEIPVPYVTSVISNKGPKNSLEDHLRSESIYLKAN